VKPAHVAAFTAAEFNSLSLLHRWYSHASGWRLGEQ